VLTVGIYEGTTEASQLLNTVRQRVTNGAIVIDTTIATTTPARTPTFVEIDPEIRLIDRDRFNNRLMLSADVSTPGHHSWCCCSSRAFAIFADVARSARRDAKRREEQQDDGNGNRADVRGRGEPSRLL